MTCSKSAFLRWNRSPWAVRALRIAFGFRPRALQALAAAVALLPAYWPRTSATRSPVPQRADTALVAAARTRPDSVRAEIVRRLVLSATVSMDSASERHTADARDLARAYAIAWRDSFFVRQVERFVHLTPDQRATKIASDSLRRAGNEALGRAGTAAALRLWRRSLRLATTLGDSAGQATALGNIAAGFLRAGQLDSAVIFGTRARNLATGAGDLRTAGNAIGLLATVSKDRGDLSGADALFAVAAEVRARSGDSRGMAADRNNLGLIAQALGDLGRAQREFDAALATNRSENRPTAAAVNLVNLANLASLGADFSLASSLYREALAIHGAGGNSADAAAIVHKLGLLEMRRGDYERAGVELREALSLAEATGSTLESIAVRADLAITYAALGRLQLSVSTLRGAERDAQRSGAGPKLLAALAVARADLSVQLNDLAAAERAYSRAASLSRTARDVVGQAEAAHGHGLLRMLRGDQAGAMRILSRAANALSDAGDRRSAALTRVLLGRAQAQRGDSTAGRRSLAVASRELAVLGDPVGEASALAVEGDLASGGGALLAAEAFYRRGLERLGTLQAPGVRWQLRAGLGAALRSRGALADAARELRLAVSDIERVSVSIPLEERRAAFLADKWDVFAQLALTERARGRDADAFAISERMRARQMLDLLTRGHTTRPTSRPDDARGRILQDRISTLTRSLERGRTGDPALRGPGLDARALNPEREALDAAQKEYAALLAETTERHAASVRIASGEPVDWRAVAARLRPDEVLLEYLVTDSSSVVFVITRDTLRIVELDVSRRELTGLIEFSRGTISRPAVSATGALWRSSLRRLARVLIAPVQAAGHLAGKRALVIVPHGELHFLPFQALVIDASPERFLIERFTVQYAPSASVWLLLKPTDQAASEESVLAMAPRSDALPASRSEVEAIGRVYRERATVLVGAEASEAAFRDLAATRSIVHIASYGILNKHNPLFSFVELAPLNGHDGRLEVHEVLSMSLSARLLVLSACQTGLGSGAIADVPPGDDWVGLVRGFHHAGASKVLATLWSVEDRATARLMEVFYRELATGRSESESIAHAQRVMLSEPRTAHPFYWAGFILSGGR